MDEKWCKNKILKSDLKKIIYSVVKAYIWGKHIPEIPYCSSYNFPRLK